MSHFWHSGLYLLMNRFLTIWRKKGKKRLIVLFKRFFLRYVLDWIAPLSGTYQCIVTFMQSCFPSWYINKPDRVFESYFMGDCPTSQPPHSAKPRGHCAKLVQVKKYVQRRSTWLILTFTAAPRETCTQIWTYVTKATSSSLEKLSSINSANISLFIRHV